MKNTPLSVILMVHNEEDTIISEVKNYYQKIIKKLPGSELIVAEDGSRDRTREILYGLVEKLPLVLLVTPKKRGYAKSLRLAFTKAKGELVFYADAGGKHDPEDFWKLYKKIPKYDFVTGNKSNRHDPWYRLFLAWGLNKIVNIYFKVSFSDIDSGFKLFKDKVKKNLLQERWILTNNISLEIVLRVVAGKFKTTEVAVKHFARKTGASRGLPLKKIPRAVFNILLSLPKLKNNIFESN
ncbi:glycosyltransferase family 2 protein [Candidatus Gottesmanbacteria bacterium]|nr:glycosyltransferase family 2 protein [Candidatus Gottesmanbacteria bacterium]